MNEMNKKLLENQCVNIPKDNIECWELYPKYHWVYDLSRLFDTQNIKWSPYKTSELSFAIFNLRISPEDILTTPCDKAPGYIYIKQPVDIKVFTEVFIIKGEIKLMRHVDPMTLCELDELIGEIELRLSAFVALYFKKFTGVFCAETYKNEIYGISLRPLPRTNITDDNYEVLKLLKRIYPLNTKIDNS